MNKLLFGLIAGAAAGLLMAPSTGVELREKISGAYDELSESVLSRVNEFAGTSGSPTHSGGSTTTGSDL